LAAAYYCLHHPQGVIPEYAIQCACRKPLPYFLFKARDSFDISLSESWMIGDRITDVQCGAAAATRTIRVAPDHPCRDPDTGAMKANFEASDLMQAAEIILRNSIHRAMPSVRPHQGNGKALGIEFAQ
jgi:D-glycero-D-manno-heptose 1,7-bisphosphate phosphatase